MNAKPVSRNGWPTCERFTNLELHRRVLLILWRGVALVVEVVGRGRMDDGRLLRRLVEALAVHVDQEGQKTGAHEAGHPGGDQVDGRERCPAKKNEKTNHARYFSAKGGALVCASIERVA